jgi:hypothetical protein
MEEYPYLDTGHPPGTGRRYVGQKAVCMALSNRCFVSIWNRNGHPIDGTFAPVLKKDLPHYGFPTNHATHSKMIVQRYDAVEHDRLVYRWRIIPWEDIGKILQDKKMPVEDRPFPLPPPR